MLALEHGLVKEYLFSDKCLGTVITSKEVG